MNGISKLGAAIILTTGLSALALQNGISAVEATLPEGTPENYVTADLASAQKSLSVINSLSASGRLDSDALFALNPHRVVITPRPVSRPGGLPGRRPPAPPPITPPPVVSVARVDNAGVFAGKQTLQISGTLLKNVSNWTLDCGERASSPLVASQSDTAIVITIAPILTDSQCTLNGAGLPVTNGFTFDMNGLTCGDWNALCPSATVGTFDTKATDGSAIHIDIQNGPTAADTFTPTDINNLKAELSHTPVDLLKNVKVVQSNPTAYKDGGSGAWSGAAGRGGVIYVASTSNLPFSSWQFPIGYGLGELVLGRLSTAEKTFWKNNLYSGRDWAQGFGTYFMDWNKNTTDILHDMGSLLQYLLSNPPDLKADSIRYDVQTALTMLTHFYDPKKKEVYVGYGWGNVPVTFTKTTIQVSDVVFFLDSAGTSIIAQGSGSRRATYPAPVPIPEFFLQTVPRT